MMAGSFVAQWWWLAVPEMLVFGLGGLPLPRFWILLYGDATRASISHRFDQRVIETVSGVMIAYVFGLVIPKLRPAA